MLEQIMYQPNLSRQESQIQGTRLYNTNDLEELGAEALYGSDILKSRFTNDGIENIRIDKDGDTFKIYSNLLKNNLSIGFQPYNLKHKDYKENWILELDDLF